MRLDSIGKQYIHRSAVEAARAGQRLGDACGFAVPVVGILAFVEVVRIVLKAPLGENGIEVRAIKASSLVGTMSGRRVFSDDQVARIVFEAEKSQTWSRSTLSSRPESTSSRSSQLSRPPFRPISSRAALLARPRLARRERHP